MPIHVEYLLQIRIFECSSYTSFHDGYLFQEGLSSVLWPLTIIVRMFISSNFSRYFMESILRSSSVLSEYLFSYNLWILWWRVWEGVEGLVYVVSGGQWDSLAWVKGSQGWYLLSQPDVEIRRCCVNVMLCFFFAFLIEGWDFFKPCTIISYHLCKPLKLS